MAANQKKSNQKNKRKEKKTKHKLGEITTTTTTTETEAVDDEDETVETRLLGQEPGTSLKLAAKGVLKNLLISTFCSHRFVSLPSCKFASIAGGAGQGWKVVGRAAPAALLLLFLYGCIRPPFNEARSAANAERGKN